jgi:act minimal PKS acyl carrier protein
MSHLTFPELTRILVECSGADDTTDLTEEALDTPFTDLGFDSLAVLETAAAVGERYGAELSDKDLARADTPRAFLLLVNETLSAAA